MRWALSLGIADPLARVVVWLAGCAATTAAGAIAGLTAAAVTATVLVVAAAGRVADAGMRCRRARRRER